MKTRTSWWSMRMTGWGRISDSVQTTLADARTVLKDASKDLDGVSSDARRLLQGVDHQVKPVMKKILTVLNSANNALDGATKALVTVDGFVGERSGTRHKLNRALEEIAGAGQIAQIPDGLSGATPERVVDGKRG